MRERRDGSFMFCSYWKHQKRNKTDDVHLLQECRWLWGDDQFRLSGNSVHHISCLIFPWRDRSVIVCLQPKNTALIFISSLNFQQPGCLHVNKVACFVVWALEEAILHPLSTSSSSSSSLRWAGRSWGSPLAPPMHCRAGGSSDPSQGGSWAEAARCVLGDLFPPKSSPSRSQLAAGPSSTCPALPRTAPQPPLPKLCPCSPAQLVGPGPHRNGGHLPAPGWICLQFHRVDRGGGGDRHQRLGGDVRLHHHHLQENGWAGLQGAVGRLRHGDRPLSLQAPRGHPHLARYVSSSAPSSLLPQGAALCSPAVGWNAGEAPSASSAPEMVH